MRGSVDVADIGRRYWPLWLIAGTVLLETLIFAGYLLHRQDAANIRTEKQRQAICAILANIPGRVPTEIERARVVFAPAGHPTACAPLPGATPSPTPVRVYINGKPATIIVNPPPPQHSQSRPTATRTASPRPTGTPTPSPSPSRTPSPTPSPSPSHCIAIPLHKPVCI